MQACADGGEVETGRETELDRYVRLTDALYRLDQCVDPWEKKKMEGDRKAVIREMAKVRL